MTSLRYDAQAMKLSGTHTSLIKLAEKLLRWLDRSHPELKVSPGIIISRRSSRSRNQKIKMIATETGLLITITDNSTIQELRIFSNDTEGIITTIESFGDKNKINIQVTW